MFTETPGFAQSIFPISKPIRQECFQILYQDEALPSNLLRHMCGKLQSLKLEGNASMKMAECQACWKAR